MLVIEPNLKREIEALVEKSNQYCQSKKYEQSIKLREMAWDKIPEPKGLYDESYYIVSYIIDIYFITDSFDQAEKWLDKLFLAGLDRFDSGEREFYGGQISFGLKKYEVAKEYFRIAEKKSGGRYVQGKKQEALEMDLDDEIYEKITTLCEEGDELLEDELFDQSIQKYEEALQLVPTPKKDWDTSTWIYTALGEACYFKGSYQQGKNYLYEAMNCPDGNTNPLILLRLGEVLFECEEKEKAREYLLRAYMLEGYEIFEDEDEKYFSLIKDLV